MMKNENDVERFADFKFITPGAMVDDDLTLELEEMCPYNPEKKHVPEYKFAMVNTHTQTPMGKIRLRVGLTEMLRQYGGHIGYEVDEPYRGHRYAARSCRLLLPLIRALGINPVIITCDPNNIASAKTIESLGAELMATKEVEFEPGDFRRTSNYYLYLEQGIQ
jgi:predicted acetyltransferase